MWVGDTSNNYPDHKGKHGSATWGGVAYDHYPDFAKDADGRRGPLSPSSLTGCCRAATRLPTTPIPIFSLAGKISSTPSASTCRTWSRRWRM